MHIQQIVVTNAIPPVPDNPGYPQFVNIITFFKIASGVYPRRDKGNKYLKGEFCFGKPFSNNQTDDNNDDSPSYVLYMFRSN